MAWYIPRWEKGIMSELITVAGKVSLQPLRTCQALTHGNQAAAAESRQGSHHVELCHAARCCASKASQHEGHGGDEEANAPPEQVREAPVQRLEGSARDKVRRREP